VQDWVSCLVFFLVAITCYGVALVLRKMSIMDLIWSLGLGAGATLIFLEASSENASSLRAYFALGLILAWSLRLSGHLFFNRILKENEDARYQRLIEHAGRFWKAVFLFLFLTQVVLVYVFLIPIRTAIESPVLAFAWHDWLALCIGILALIGETISDNQLKQFSSDPENEGKVCKRGFWRYSRHPNYFFEWLFWWTFVFFSLGSASFFFSLIGPLVMYGFLRYISGVPFAELSSLERRGEAYRSYQKETSVFFPKMPKLKINND